jgi:pimeloyl-ACP methyl ester carboxylesterase
MQLRANGIALEVEDEGPRDGAPLLLIMGLGMQLTAWHEGFVALLAARGFRVIRFDNRDSGLSQGFDSLGVPKLGLATLRFALGWPLEPPYTLSDMAADSVGVLDALGIESAHVCGASMGGMIAQHIAVQHASRIRSLTLMMTSSGARHLPGPTLRVKLAMLASPRDPNDVASIVQRYERLMRAIRSPGYPPDVDEAVQIERSVRRAYRPRGTLRQLAAIGADADRSALLARIAAPTQIIHGLDDPLVPVAAAHDLMAKMPGAALDLVAGMGHDLPRPLWPRFVDDIAGVARI